MTLALAQALKRCLDRRSGRVAPAEAARLEELAWEEIELR